MTGHRTGTASTLLGLVLTFGLAVPSPSSAQQLPADDACSVIASVAVLTMEQEELLADSDVLICGTRIRALGPSGSLVLPPGTRRIEGRGQVLMPGLTDGHIHLFAVSDLEVDLGWGVTTVRNMFGSPLSLNLRDRIHDGALWGPRMITAGPIIDGDPAVWPGSVAVSTAEAARKVVAEQVAAGYDFIKVYSRLEPEPFFAAIAAAKQAGVRVGGHVPESVPLVYAVVGGIEFIEHLTGYLKALQGPQSPWSRLSPAERAGLDGYESTRLLVEGFDPPRLLVVAGWMKERGVWNIPTFVVIERITASAEQKEKWTQEHPAMKWVSPMARAMWNPKNDFRLRDATPEQLAARHRSAELHAPIVKALFDAGCELMLGTDTPNPFVFPGYSVHEELERFVAAGLTPYQALATATVNAARFLGLETTIGRIAPGLDADLVLLEASPLEVIANTKRIAGVMTRGRWLDRTELDRRLAAVAKASGNR